MKLYAFELGRKKDLCHAELMAVLGQNSFVERNLDTSIFRLDLNDPQKLQNRLGGTIKIIEIFAELPPESGQRVNNLLLDTLGNRLKETFKDHSGKIQFSLSLLGFFDVHRDYIKIVLKYSKEILKSLGSNSRFVNKNFENSKPSTIYKARVLEKGIDICVIKGKNKIFLGESVAIQDIDSYSARDYGKPKRDAHIGMMPPKLAQIMINLSNFHEVEPKIIYDPFCGTGTVLMETMLMDRTAIGSDINIKMLAYTKENCEWTNKEFQTKSHFRIFEKDARELDKKDLPEKIDAIVTESYLGKAISRLPQDFERKNTFIEICSLHRVWLRKVHTLTPKTCKIVMCLPAYRKGPSIEHCTDFWRFAKECGYKVVASFTYDRPDQLIARDVLVLEKIS